VGGSAESFRSATVWSLARRSRQLPREIQFESTTVWDHCCYHLHLHHAVVAPAVESLGRSNGDDRQLRIHPALLDDFHEDIDSVVETER